MSSSRLPGHPRPGTSITAPTASERSRRRWAVGYISTPGPLEAGTWTRWHADVEAQALCQDMPMLHVFSDERSEHSAAPERALDGEISAVATPEAASGLARMVSAIRELAHLRSGHVSVVIVPRLEHLSPVRDGSEQTVAMLLGLHLGVTVQTVEPVETRGSTQSLAMPITERATSRPAAVAPGEASGDNRRLTRLAAGLAFGELLHGVHGDPDRIPVWTPPRTPAGPR